MKLSLKTNIVTSQPIVYATIVIFLVFVDKQKINFNATPTD